MKIAVIPARGGSKRIPKKNIKAFAGQPLIAYSIKAAQESGLFDDIIVSTDDEAIAELAKQYGAKVPFMRPDVLSDDMTGTRPVTNHAIEWYRDNIATPTFCCCIYATAPFLQAKYLQHGLQGLLDDPSKGFAYSVTSFPFPIQRALFLKENYAFPAFQEDIYKRSQDLPEAYHDAGQFYWGTTEDYLSPKAIFSEHGIPVVLPRHLVQDIDTPEDWDRAELMYQAYMMSKAAKS
ncbi:pseudaminic acid cytidylyltransferase [Brumicola blandensis]|uniref:Pseudaminic acid cytidylyltransferase n=1 Tax=Brumicola blandensis TaxID=3075611 RepID=A0AAW8R3S4_9ALTE|nr:pseudaminic acid cytidylyltransferase [Alteromonas sp. W409]MDT0582816.1 pseudaminic acid cytidylyltransferase [Alteromonas sp. W409]